MFLFLFYINIVSVSKSYACSYTRELMYLYRSWRCIIYLNDFFFNYKIVRFFLSVSLCRASQFYFIFSSVFFVVDRFFFWKFSSFCYHLFKLERLTWSCCLNLGEGKCTSFALLPCCYCDCIEFTITVDGNKKGLWF